MYIKTPQLREEKELSLKYLLIQSALVLAVTFIFSQVVLSVLWKANPALCHTALELLCIMMAFALFSVTWYTYERISPTNTIMGLGFLMVAVFESFHVIYTTEMGLCPQGFEDLGTRYWLFSRVTLVLVLLAVAAKPFHRKVNKLLGLSLALAVSLLLSFILLRFPGILPALYVKGIGATSAKASIEYFLVFLTLICLFIIRKEVNNRGILKYKYIFMALIILVAAD